MRVFVTGATGFIGTAIVQELISAGHQVLGLARSDASAQALIDAGADVLRGDVENLDSLRSGAKETDGVIHAGFIHEFHRFKEVCEIDRIAITAIGEALAGTDKTFIVTSGTALVSPGKLATEDLEPAGGSHSHPRVASEEAVDAVAAMGVRVAALRLSPSVHGDGDHGFVPMLIDIARNKGLSAYIGEGQNRWTGVHKLDAAHLYRLALENAVKGAHYHGADEEGIPFKDIAEVIGKHLNLPVKSISTEEAAENFGWFVGFASLDIPVSSKLTREQLNWQPVQAGLLEDMEHGTYFKG